MKIPQLHAISACCWLALATALHAEPAKAEKSPSPENMDLPRQIRVQVEFIDVSHEQLTELMFGDKTPNNDGELRKQVAQLVKDGKATAAETMICIARSGQKATTESVEEFIYPTEYEPAEISIESSAKEKDTAKDATGLATEKQRDNATGPTPCAFETRNLGSTLEIEPTLAADGRTVDLRLVPEIVHHVGNQVWAEWKGEHGTSPIQMPNFYTLRLNTAVTLSAGKPMLVGVLSPKNAQGLPDPTRKLMVFVKADVVTTEP